MTNEARENLQAAIERRLERLRVEEARRNGERIPRPRPTIRPLLWRASAKG